MSADDATVLQIESDVLSHNLFTYCRNEPIKNVDPYGYWVLTIGVSWGIAVILGVNIFATLLIDSTWDYGLFFGATLLYGVMARGLSGSLGIYLGFKKSRIT